MKLKVTVNQTEYEIDVEVEQEERPQLSPIVIGVNGGSNPIPTKASVSAVSSNAVVAPLVLVPMFGWGFFIGSLVPLLVGAVANVAVGVIVARALAAAGLAETPTK